MLPSLLSAGHSIHAIAGRDPLTLHQFQHDFAIPSTYLDLDAVLGDPTVDAVYIALPNSMHAEWTVRSLHAGKRVLCEKPLALNLAEADRVVAAARHAVLLENFCYRLPPVTAPLRAIEARFSFQATPEHRSRFTRALGGGSFLDLGCYGVDFAHRLLPGDLEILDVQAIRQPGDGEYPDVDQACLLRARCGAVSVEIESSFAAPPRQEFLLRSWDGSVECLQRSDDTAGMLKRFAQMQQSDPADLLRCRRNASVYEQVLARMGY